MAEVVGIQSKKNIDIIKVLEELLADARSGVVDGILIIDNNSMIDKPNTASGGTITKAMVSELAMLSHYWMTIVSTETHSPYIGITEGDDDE